MSIETKVHKPVQRSGGISTPKRIFVNEHSYVKSDVPTTKLLVFFDLEVKNGVFNRVYSDVRDEDFRANAIGSNLIVTGDGGSGKFITGTFLVTGSGNDGDNFLDIDADCATGNADDGQGSITVPANFGFPITAIAFKECNPPQKWIGILKFESQLPKLSSPALVLLHINAQLDDLDGRLEEEGTLKLELTIESIRQDFDAGTLTHDGFLALTRTSLGVVAILVEEFTLFSTDVGDNVGSNQLHFTFANSSLDLLFTDAIPAFGIAFSIEWDGGVIEIEDDRVAYTAIREDTGQGHFQSWIEHSL